MENAVIKARSCKESYEEMWLKGHSGEITEQEWNDWYAAHCANCPCMSEVCMKFEILEELQ